MNLAVPAMPPSACRPARSWSIAEIGNIAMLAEPAAVTMPSTVETVLSPAPEAPQEHAEGDAPLSLQNADGERNDRARFERGLEADNALWIGVELEAAAAAIDGGIA